MIAVAACLLGEHLKASRVMFAEFDEARGIADIFYWWVADGSRPFPAAMQLKDYEGSILDDMRAGRTVRVNDSLDTTVARPDLLAIAEVGARALLTVPLTVGGKLVVNLSVHQHAPRHWTNEDVLLVQEVSERLWADLIRARIAVALRDSEERFRQFAAWSRDALWIRDASTPVMEYGSPAIQEIYGAAPEAMLGDIQHWAALIVPEDRTSPCSHRSGAERQRNSSRVPHPTRRRREVSLDPRYQLPATR